MAGSRAKPVAAGIMAVLLWSVHGTVARLTQFEAGSAMITACAFLAAWIVLAASLVALRVPIREHIAILGVRALAGLLLCGGILMAYFLCLYLAFERGPVVEVYVIHYLWPILGAIFTSMVLRGRQQRVTLVEWMFVIFAFFGALMIIVGREGFDPGDVSTTGYVLAFVSALSGGLYLIALVYGIDRLERRGVGHYEAFSLCYLVLVSGALIAASLFLAWTGDVATVPSPAAILGIAFLGILVYVVAEWGWIYSLMNYRSSAITSISYLTPVFGTFFLVLLAGGTISEFTVYGTATIIISNVFIHLRGYYGTATLGALVASLSIAILCLVTRPSAGMPDEFSLVEVLGVIFTIIISFSLNKLWQAQKESDRGIADIGSVLQRMHAADPDAADVRAREGALDALFVAMIDYDFGHTRRNREDLVRRIYSRLDDVEALFATASATREATGLNDLRLAVDRWIADKSDTMATGEYITNILLGVLLIFVAFWYRPGGLVGDVMAVVFGGGVSFLLLLMRDLKNNLVERDFSHLMSTQRFFRRIGRAYYIPQPVWAAGAIPRSHEVRTYRYRDRDGVIQTDGAMAAPSAAERWLTNGVVSAGIIAILGMLIVKQWTAVSGFG